MKSAKEFANWLAGQLKDVKSGVYLTRSDIGTLSGRQRFTPDFIRDVHYELAFYGMGFVGDLHREKYYLFHLPTEQWIVHGEGSQEPKASNVHSITDKKTKC